MIMNLFTFFKSLFEYSCTRKKNKNDFLITSEIPEKSLQVLVATIDSLIFMCTSFPKKKQVSLLVIVIFIIKKNKTYKYMFIFYMLLKKKKKIFLLVLQVQLSDIFEIRQKSSEYFNV